MKSYTDIEQSKKLAEILPTYPYCRECLDKAKMELMIKLKEIDKKYKK